MIAIVGTLVFLVGIITIPYPGPGILITFAGLAILATEFKFAQGVLDKLRRQYDRWKDWLGHQDLLIKSLFWIATFLVVTMTAWLINTFGVVNRILNLNQDWLISPLSFFQ